MSKLKIFVSSTSYDLQMVRSEIRPFLIEMGHEPILSEDGDVLYKPTLHTHESCLNEVIICDVVILIIGSRFGGKCVPSALLNLNTKKLSNASSNKKIFDTPENISITQAEVLKAIEHGIPIYTFILDNVLNDHHLYEKNKGNYKIIDEIEFPSIQNKEYARYIFEFINFILHRNENNNISKFSNPIDIKNHLKQQFSGLLQDMLAEKRLGLSIASSNNGNAFANIKIVEGNEGYLILLASLIDCSEREVLFTSTRMAGTNEDGVYGTLQKSIIDSSIQFQKRNPNRLHYGIIDAGSVETSSGATELRAKVPDIVLRFNDELNSIKVNFFISDESKVVLRMNKGGKNNRYSVLIQNKHLATILKRYFYSLWNKSKFMNEHLRAVVEHNSHTFEDVLESSGKENVDDFFEFLEFLNKIDRTHQIIPSRFIEKVIHAKVPHSFGNDIIALKKYKDFFISAIGNEKISHHEINEIKMRVMERLPIDYKKLSKAFFVQYFPANYFKARHSLESIITKIDQNKELQILDLGGGGGHQL